MSEAFTVEVGDLFRMKGHGPDPVLVLVTQVGKEGVHYVRVERDGAGRVRPLPDSELALVTRAFIEASFDLHAAGRIRQQKADLAAQRKAERAAKRTELQS